VNLDVDQLLDEVADRMVERLAPLLAPAALCNGVTQWRLLNLEEAADRLGRSTRWVRERAKRGDLAYVKLDGGALAFTEEDLRAFAEARRVCADRVQEGRNAALRNGSGDPDRVGNRRVKP
jgi:hypothetical protein